RARAQAALPRPRRRNLPPARRHAADHAAGGNPHQPADRGDRWRRIRRAGTDIALGLYRLAPFYYYPGFNKPNGTGECIVALKVWNALSDELKAIVTHACATEAN